MICHKKTEKFILEILNLSGKDLRNIAYYMVVTLEKI